MTQWCYLLLALYVLASVGLCSFLLVRQNGVGGYLSWVYVCLWMGTFLVVGWSVDWMDGWSGGQRRDGRTTTSIFAWVERNNCDDDMNEASKINVME